LAKNAGVAAIGVSWGNHDTESLRAAGAGAILDTFDELDGVLTTRHGSAPP
jgi:phosphoglycolate phosphatase